MNQQEDRIVCADLAKGRERCPIPVINNFSMKLPTGFEYINNASHSRAIVAHLEENEKNSQSQGCSCDRDEEGRYQCKESCECHASSSIYFDVKSRILYEPASIEFYTEFYVECGRHCNCKGSCKRQVLPGTKLVKKLKLVMTADKGWGVFSAQPIAAGMPIGEYIGEVHDRISEWDGFGDSDYQQDVLFLQKKKKIHFIVDSGRCGNITRFLNHSCFPNVVPVAVYSTIPSKDRQYPVPRVILVSTRDILANQELTFSYGAPYFITRGIKCKCYQACCLVPPKDWIKKCNTVEDIKDELKFNGRWMYLSNNWRAAKDIEEEEIVLD